MKTLQRTFKELLRYPSAIAGLIIIFLLLIISAYAMITIPYSRAITLWRGGAEIWGNYPKNAAPAWINYFRKEKLPVTIILNTANGTASKTVENVSADTNAQIITFTFDYPYDTYPQEMALHFNAKYVSKQPHVTVLWQTPDGREIKVGDFSVKQSETYRFSQDTKLQKKLKGLAPQIGLFVADPAAQPPLIVKGTYKLVINAITFEKDADIDSEFVLYGELYGLAGTDHLRRDLLIALLWGTPIALAFGLLAAIGTTMSTMIISAMGVWFGGWIDDLIQRITEVNMVLPFLPIMIMVGTFYSRSIWVILGATILLSIFTGSIKTYRSMFLQVKESPYVEAAQAYGAGSWRIIFRYLTPRMIPLLIPQVVTGIPGFVFLEASLAFLGLGDPTLPTWGKVINDAQMNGALYVGLYFWVLEPAALLMITGLAFAMLGYSLDRIFNPRLRGI